LFVEMFKAFCGTSGARETRIEYYDHRPETISRLCRLDDSIIVETLRKDRMRIKWIGNRYNDARANIFYAFPRVYIAMKKSY
ncbi:hypothetical protein PFISCL1PPCAC_18186, partial [Pristionchus fissidentatus]